MAVANGITVKKEIYEWAITESRKDTEEIKIKFPNFEKWINQETQPTFRQIEKLANYFKVPLGYMFLDKPPISNIIEGEFRTIGNKLPNISKNLEDTIYEMGRKQDWISQYRKDNGWDKIVLNSEDLSQENNEFIFAKKAKQSLNLDDFWYREYNDYRLAYNFLRRKLEGKGIIVMQNGIVGGNTHRKLEMKEFRGFMLYDEFAPLIFINTNDSQAGKIFTLIHEYIHMLFEKDDIFIDKDLKIDNDLDLEYRINKITAEFLMPKSHIRSEWNSNENSLSQIENLSILFNVSKIALAIRLETLGMINRSLINKVKEITNEDLRNKKNQSSGGNYWTTYKSRYSNSFIESVIYGAEAGDISYSYAFNLLNVKAKSYDVLIKHPIK